ncbi:spore coat protein [Clostridia bacterium]|nr:spore coat protein [Clostridia bacterium]
MSNITKGNITLDKKIARETTQYLHEGEIIVPDNKPDIASLLISDANVLIERAEAGSGRVAYTGLLLLNVSYLARGATKQVCGLKASHTVDDFLNMEEITPASTAEVSAVIENVEYKVINDRKIGFRAVLSVAAAGITKETSEIITDIDGEGIGASQLLKSELKINKYILSRRETVTAGEDITLSAGKPNIREVLWCGVTVVGRDVKTTRGKASVSGTLNVNILYKGDDDKTPLYIEQEIPYTVSAESDELTENQFADVNVYAGETNVNVKPDVDGEDRVLSVEAAVNASFNIYALDSLQVLEDAYSLNQTAKIEKSEVKYSKLICRNKNQTQIKEVITLPPESPEVLQIFRAKGDVFLDETKVIDDKVIAEGFIKCDVLYIAGSDETPLYSYKCDIPYRQVIETKGARAGCIVHIESVIEHAGVNMLSGKEAELRFLLCFNVSVSEERSGAMITSIEFTDMTREELAAAPSMVIYTAQKGDTLFNVAKKYNTTTDDIASINEIEPTDKIFAGQKFLIVKRTNL